MLHADMNITEGAQVLVYLTSDVPRTRAYSVNIHSLHMFVLPNR